MGDSEFYLTADQAARLLGISAQSVRRRARRGQIAAVVDSVSGRYRIPREAVLRQLRPAAGPPRPAACYPPDPVAEATLRALGL